MFVCHELNGKIEVTFFICSATLSDHVIKLPLVSVGGNPLSKATFLSSMVVIGLAEVEICCLLFARRSNVNKQPKSHATFLVVTQIYSHHFSKFSDSGDRSGDKCILILTAHDQSVQKTKSHEWLPFNISHRKAAEIMNKMVTARILEVENWRK